MFLICLISSYLINYFKKKIWILPVSFNESNLKVHSMIVNTFNYQALIIVLFKKKILQPKKK